MRKYTPQMLLYRHSLTAVSVQGGLGGGKGFPGGSDGKESACSAGYLGSIPELGRSPRRGHGNPLHGEPWSPSFKQALGTTLDPQLLTHGSESPLRDSSFTMAGLGRGQASLSQPHRPNRIGL